MKKVNKNVSKKIATVIIAAVATVSVMGCSVDKNVTYTETHTHTDANGNTTSTTTTTTNHNGTVTTETYTTEEEMVAETEAEMNGEGPQAFYKVPIEITNGMGWDVAAIHLKMSSSDEWSNNFLGAEDYLVDGQTAYGITVTYNEEDRYIDLYVADSTGDGEEFDRIELPTDNTEEIEISLEMNEEDGSFHAYII